MSVASFEVVTEIDAPPAGCFDLARDVDFHVQSLQHTGERVVGGVQTGLLGTGDEVTWEGRHLGVRQRLTSRITAFDPPRWFQDRMIKGAFRSFEHDHHFEASPTGGTIMRDVVRFGSPAAGFGWLVDRVVLRPYLRRLIRQRGVAIKLEAERRRAAVD